MIAIGAMRAVHDAGMRVPEDISVIGYDGIEYTRFTLPRLATVRQDIGEQPAAFRGGGDIVEHQLVRAAG